MEVSNEKSVMSVLAIEISNAFENNEIAVQDRFSNKTIAVTVVVS